MIELNLLPEEFKIKKGKVSDLTSIPVMPLIGGFLLTSVIVYFIVSFSIGLYTRSLNRLKNQWEDYTPKRKEINALKDRVKDINTKIGAIEELTEARVLWAKLLNGISDSVPNVIWLSSLYYDKKSPIPTLVLEGYAAGAEEDVGRFMDALENNNSFFDNFQHIELGFTKSSLIEKQEVTNFKIVCTFKPQTIKARKEDSKATKRTK